MVDGRPSVVLESTAAKLVMDLGGGSIVDFHIAPGGLNPLRWIGPADVNATLRPMAHFLCLDRWGPPSEAELRNGGMFSRGSDSRQVAGDRCAGTKGRRRACGNGSHAPDSWARSAPHGAAFRGVAAIFNVSETVTNRNKLGRVYNMVQHATIGPPFLDEETVVDSNALRGFMQSSPLPNPEQPEIRWPEALKRGQPVDLRRLTNDPDPNVVSFVVNGEIGWVTATNASKELIVGYIWRTVDYPWLNIWRNVANGKPLSRGLEFGTTGLHQPFKILMGKPSIFGKPTFTYLDAGESATRSYAGFLVKAPRDFRGVDNVQYREGQLVIHERDGTRELTISADRLLE